MTAIACLRVVLETGATGLREAVVGPLVEKLAGAYLETRWCWPREFSPLSHYSFLLTDPRADQLDLRELARLSDDLQTRLFGQSATGEVTLLVFEGPEAAARGFAALDKEALAAALRNEALLPAGGRLSRISAKAPVMEAAESAASDPPTHAPEPSLEVRFHGVYFSLKDVFIGDVVSAHAENRGRRASIVEGFEQLPSDPAAFDETCVEAALECLAKAPIKAILYVPVAYDNLVRPSLRAACVKRLSALPADSRNHLGAVIYGVPRDPGFGAMTQIRDTLGRHFQTIDLRVDDPAFEVEKLGVHAVAGVSFALPTTDRRGRMAALRQFASHRSHYKQRRIWASVTNVRDGEELAACAALGVPFMSGPAVCRPQLLPLGGRLIQRGDLPIREAA
ncbi:MAG: hypothetical protein Q8Q88_23135 [Phenylobacterium sp.]|uniref:hypothetical protein n=1 Tax=Phenylobacterium sp. TaxID=1871053 RepID=UPI0027339997|nr:hypothetical protein [Phenylobacterium sp.]MDP3749932.1 hypothetical protein [Phenylobacterium sp.]